MKQPKETFYLIPSSVIADPKLTAAAIRVFCFIADECGCNGDGCELSSKQIVQGASVSLVTATKSVKQLEECGHIIVNRQVLPRPHQYLIPAYMDAIKPKELCPNPDSSITQAV
jgi:hypothetical protein